MNTNFTKHRPRKKEKEKSVVMTGQSRYEEMILSGICSFRRLKGSLKNQNSFLKLFLKCHFILIFLGGWEGDMPTMSFRTTQVPLEFYDVNLKNYQANKVIQF